MLLLAIYSQYAHGITSTVALLASICLIPPYLRISAKSTPTALAFFIVVSPALYYLVGATYLVFAATCILYETLIARRWRLVVLCLLVAATVPCLIGVLLCGTPPAVALTPYAFAWNVAIPGEPLWAIWLLYLLVPAGLLLSSVAAGVGALGLANSRPAALAGITILAFAVWAVWAALTLEIGTWILPSPQTHADLGELLRTIRARNAGSSSAPSCGPRSPNSLPPGKPRATPWRSSTWWTCAIAPRTKEARPNSPKPLPPSAKPRLTVRLLLPACSRRVCDYDPTKELGQ
jgi:hypothetical protein